MSRKRAITSGRVLLPAPPETDVESVLEQLANPASQFFLNVQGARVFLRNLGREFWPEIQGRRPLTKRDLLIYLAKVSPYILRYLRGRPLSLVRFPRGIRDQLIFQKHYAHVLPDYVKTVEVYTEQAGDKTFVICDNLPTLLWLGQLAALELHSWLSNVNPKPDAQLLPTTFAGSLETIESSVLNYPDFLVFDLDPVLPLKGSEGEDFQMDHAAFQKTCQVAGWLKALLDGLSLKSFIKTSGKRGLHVCVPLLRTLKFDIVRSISRGLARVLVMEHPNEVTVNWPMEERAGKVFLDYSQNARGKTLVSPYSARGTPEASISLPLRWEELTHVYPTDFTILNIADRLTTTCDPWAGILETRQDPSRLLDWVHV